MTVPGNLSSPLLATAAEAAAAGDVATKSLRFNSGDSAYLNRTPSSAGNRKTWTWSGWVKRSKPGHSDFFSAVQDTNNATIIQFDSSDRLDFEDYQTSNAGRRITTAVFRDYSAWYHICCVYDSDNSTADDRIKLFVNGTQLTAFDSTNNPSSGHNTLVNSANAHYVGVDKGFNNHYFNGYLADVYLIDGAAVEPVNNFIELDDNGVYQAKAYSGTYGTNGFHLDFASGSDLGDDNSGNGNDFTPNNLSGFDGTIATADGALPILNTTGNHGGTVGSGTRTDSNSSNIVLALPMNGSNNGTTFTDQSATIKGSGSAKTITANGDAKTTTSESRFYGSSGVFDGTGDTLSVPASSDFDYGSGDVTVECWLYIDSHASDKTIVGIWTGWQLSYGVESGNNKFGFMMYDGSSTVSASSSVSSTDYVDKWVHLAGVRDGDTLKIFVNGSSDGTASFTGSHSTTSGTDLYIGGRSGGNNITGNINDLRIYKGVAKYSSDFNPPSRTGGSGCDSLFDAPTNGSQSDTGAGGEVSGNYCLPNPLRANSNVGFSDGNLNLNSTAGGWYSCTSTIGISSGKFYWEATAENNSSGALNSLQIGIAPANSDVLGSNAGSVSNGYAYVQSNGNKQTNGTQTSYGSSASAGDVVMVAFDADNGKIWWGKNGTWFASGDPAAGSNAAFTSIASDTYIPVFSFDRGRWIANFGARSFAYTAPSGYKALCTTNLPTPTIADGSDYFAAVNYAGNSGDGLSTTQDIVTTFSPDLVWIKDRSGTNSNHLFDTIRGAGKRILSNSSAAETDVISTLSAFNSDGFTVNGNNAVNDVGSNYISWNWDAGDDANPASNTDGSGTSSVQVRANTTAGFSIVTYTGGSSSPANSDSGDSFGHGLGVAPDLVICKKRTGTNSWPVYHRAAPTGALLLDLTNANDSSSFLFAQKDPTSTEVFLGNNPEINNSSHDYVAYCFAPVAGYSAFSSFEGTGAADNFVYTGFRSRIVWIKEVDNANPWYIYDTARNTYNTIDNILQANATSSEGTVGAGDGTNQNGLQIFSNGFAIPHTLTGTNRNGSTYIFCAWAENPFQANGGLAR